MRRLAVIMIVSLLPACANPFLRSATAVFSVTGTAKQIDVTFGNLALREGTQVWQKSEMPFTRSIAGVMPRDVVYLSAQINTSPDDGTITVTISIRWATLGKMWRDMMRQWPTPKALAACTYSSSRSFNRRPDPKRRSPKGWKKSPSGTYGT